MNLFNIFRRLHSGTVVAKNHYSANGVERETDTNFNKGKLMVSVFTAAPATTEGWSLVVHGADKSGKHQLVKEIYVEPMVWGNTPVGSTWPPAL
jgi:hypothetical protein